MNTSLKTCFKCKSDKPLNEFYSHRAMADGHLGKCKTCTKKDAAERASSPSGRKKIRAYEQKRTQTPERKSSMDRYQKARRAAHPEKYRARMAVGNALKGGKLVRQPCEVCGVAETQAHHADYSKPLDVQWLCFQHHREVAHGQKVGD